MTRGTRHEIDPNHIDEVDEVDGDETLCLVWCDTHQSWEWHWIDRFVAL
jgi:sortase (surface protein transpeptidase)